MITDNCHAHAGCALPCLHAPEALFEIMTSSTERWRSVVDACAYVGNVLDTSAARS